MIFPILGSLENSLRPRLGVALVPKSEEKRQQAIQDEKEGEVRVHCHTAHCLTRDPRL